MANRIDTHRTFQIHFDSFDEVKAGVVNHELFVIGVIAIISGDFGVDSQKQVVLVVTRKMDAMSQHCWKITKQM